MKKIKKNNTQSAYKPGKLSIKTIKGQTRKSQSAYEPGKLGVVVVTKGE